MEVHPGLSGPAVVAGQELGTRERTGHWMGPIRIEARREMTTQDERAIRSVLAGVIDSWNRHDVGGEAHCDSGGVSAASRRPQAAPCREEGQRRLRGRAAGRWSSFVSTAGGGATGTIRPSTSPRMPTSGFEVRRSYGSARPQTSIQGCSEYDRRGRHAGSCCRVHRRPPALLSRLLSKS